jgi:predicted RNase H-related nuclease YkuK (DUF458 family)
MVLDRRMFRRPSEIAPNKGPSSKGVGITSGLTRPVKMETGGDVASKYRQYLEELSPITEEMYPKQSFFERAGMSPFQFFAALGTPMQPGQTVLGKIGEAGQYLDIKPESTTGRDLASKIALEKALEKDEEKTYTLSPGEAVYDAQGNLIVEGPKKEEEEKTYTLSPGQNVYDAKGNIIATGPKKEEEEKTYTLSPGQVVYDANGKVIATGPEKEDTLPNDIQEVNAYIETLSDPNIINEATGKPWTEIEISAERSKLYGEALGTKTILSAQDQLSVLAGSEDIKLKNSIAQGFIDDIDKKGNAANSRLVNISNAEALIPGSTTGIATDFRNLPQAFLTAFPAVRDVIPDEFVGAIDDLMNTGSLPGTEVLNAISARGTLDTLAMSEMGKQTSNKEIDLLKDNIAQVVNTKEGQQLLYDIEKGTLNILQNSNNLLQEYLTTGTVNGETFEYTYQAVAKIKSLENQAFTDLSSSEEMKDRINEVIGFGNLKTKEFFLDAEPIVVDGDTYDIATAFEEGRLQFQGYSDKNGIFVDPNNVEITTVAKQPMYTLTIKDENSKSGYSTIVIPGSRFQRK